jgi:TolB-like protein
MTSLFSELKRRNVFRVGVAYVLASWAVAQVADLVLENIGAPSWVMQSLLFLLALGFIAAVIIAWAYEVTPDGIKRERDVVRDESITHETAKRLNVITIGLVLLVVGLLIVDRFFWKHTAPVPEVASAEQVVEPVGEPVPSAAPEKSIAVLPFVDMSADKDQEYFADGISEEILNALVKAEGLQVSGRTSSFSFKGKDTKIREIGRALNVAHVLEGSVRKHAEQVRVTAQLIKADDGYHLWSETYDRSLENIFDVQDDISRHVTRELLKLLKSDDEARLANTMTTNMEAYDLFLRGRNYTFKRVGDNLVTGMALLREAVSLDPEFAEAWAALAEAEIVSADYLGLDHTATSERARQSAQTAIRLNPTLALPHGVLGLIEKGEGRALASLLALEKAHEMEPNNVLVMRWLGTVWQALGRFDKSRALFKRAFTLDPRSRTESYNYAVVEFSLHNLDEAERLYEETRKLQGGSPGPFVGDIRFMRGDVEGAIDYVSRLHDEQLKYYGSADYWSKEDAEIFARGSYSGIEADRQAALALDNIITRAGDDIYYWQLYSHIKIGNFERAFEILEQQPSFFSGFASDFVWLSLPRMVEFRQQPGFPALLERHGFVEAWQQLGWPDQCQPDPGTDGSNAQFSCN